MEIGKSKFVQLAIPSLLPREKVLRARWGAFSSLNQCEIGQNNSSSTCRQAQVEKAKNKGRKEYKNGELEQNAAMLFWKILDNFRFERN